MGEMLLRHFMMMWTTIDPIGNLAIFAALTASLSHGERRKVALRATVYAGIILIVAVVIGQILLDAIGIHLLSLKLAGGLILFVFSLKMLFGDMDSDRRAPEPGRDIAVFPLAVPSIAGPGTIMAVIVLTDNDVYTVPEQALTSLMLFAVLVMGLDPDSRDGDYPRGALGGARHGRTRDRGLGTGEALSSIEVSRRPKREVINPTVRWRLGRRRGGRSEYETDCN